MKKTLKLLLLAVMMMMGGSTLAATTVKWLASSGNSLSSSIAVDDYITLTWSMGGSDYNPKYQDGYVHFYSRNRVTEPVSMVSPSPRLPSPSRRAAPRR